MFALVADSDTSVQNAAQFLNNLVKVHYNSACLSSYAIVAQDLTTGASHFDMDSFVPLLEECLTVTNPFKRQFLLSWVAVLDSVPDIDLLQVLPRILPGLLEMLNDPHREIRQAANKLQQVLLCFLCTYTVLCATRTRLVPLDQHARTAWPPQELLLEVQSTGRLDWTATSAIVVDRIRTILAIQADQRSLTHDVVPGTPAGGTTLPEGGDLLAILNATLVVLLRWLKEVVVLAQGQLVGSYPDILSAVLPSSSHANDDVAQVVHMVLHNMKHCIALKNTPCSVRLLSCSHTPTQLARGVNDVLLALPPDAAAGLDTAAVLASLAAELGSDREATRLAAIHWLNTLLTSSRPEVGTWSSGAAFVVKCTPSLFCQTSPQKPTHRCSPPWPPSCRPCSMPSVPLTTAWS